MLSCVPPENMPESVAKKEKGSQLPDFSLRLTTTSPTTLNSALEKKLDVSFKPLLISVDLQIIDRFYPFFSTPKTRRNPPGFASEHIASRHPTLNVDEIMDDIDSANARNTAFPLHTKVVISCPLIRADLLAPRTIVNLKWKPDEVPKEKATLPKAGYFPSYDETLIVDLFGLRGFFFFSLLFCFLSFLSCDCLRRISSSIH